MDGAGGAGDPMPRPPNAAPPPKVSTLLRQKVNTVDLARWSLCAVTGEWKKEAGAALGPGLGEGRRQEGGEGGGRG